MRLRWSNVKGLSFAELESEMRREAKVVGRVTLADLVAPEPRESNGLYAFFEGKNCMYVGSARSRALIERVPAHFDLRPYPMGWFGTLLRYLADPRKNLDLRGASTPQAVLERALKFRVAVIFANVKREEITAAETAMRHAFEPKLNQPRAVRRVQGSISNPVLKGK